jgi:hypothetical protein
MLIILSIKDKINNSQGVKIIRIELKELPNAQHELTNIIE